ncbi:helix-turn-helix domain-containing protein [Methylocystis parvus]|uniref:Helix-turn-helix domain-containing protein n=1 Tax=Methylocystis parvus TaxID=134 RepID=A0A6B8MGX5_9HYPH|nr:helix-turn-helix domain-containing protein [Methylocystis parvus]QGM99920.1 helix-turn-helix domain-containing protein [Methylocystis parvus]WBK02342.1 XRE family transcriptional regulator [Methylocystis parvus OBBP]
MTTLQEKIAGLPAPRRARIAERTTELIAEENALKQLREAHKKTQVRVAKVLGIGQDSVSRLEKRSDMLISTLRDYVAAVGGKMRLVVEFEDHPPIELEALGVLKKPAKIRRRRLAHGKRAPKAA